MRRARRATPASPTTATPTAASRWTPTATLVDGDQILALLALAPREQGRLAHDTVVTTVMTNLGFKLAMERHGHRGRRDAGRRPLRAGGDARHGLALGGEQSGHIVLLDHATTGDGLLTALHLLPDGARPAGPLADLATVMTRLPQVLMNVPVADRRRGRRAGAGRGGRRGRGGAGGPAGCWSGRAAPSRWSG